MLTVDLHCHSNVSDGVLSPTALANYASKAGVDVWALTDHDEVDGIAEARAAAKAAGMRFVPGVEISITWANSTVHIVGLQVDETNEVLAGGLAATRSGRDARGRDKELGRGASAPGTAGNADTAMLQNLFGVKLKQVQGYSGSADKRLAVERGEIDGECGGWTSVPEDWLRTSLA